jgi:hypothetical protein
MKNLIAIFIFVIGLVVLPSIPEAIAQTDTQIELIDGDSLDSIKAKEFWDTTRDMIFMVRHQFGLLFHLLPCF